MKNPKLEDDYRELDLKPGASLEEVRISYRELALFWHPDRRNDGAGRGSKAHQKMTRINLAYERLRKALSRKGPSRFEPGAAKRQRSQGDQSPPAGHQRSQAEQQQRPREARTNSLGMKFAPAGTKNLLFCVWLTRVRDYEAFVNEMLEYYDQSSQYQTGSMKPFIELFVKHEFNIENISYEIIQALSKKGITVF